MNNNLLVGLLIVVIVFSLYQAVQINDLKKSLGGGTVTTASGSTSGGGETYEQMMARMHPDQVQASSNSGPAMVGGC
ncbi:hypothetical protein HYS50_02520 [Candidatus Woesearchaeota archaeon]|nr:hypothetical protein [Candidatus Woesearchaeota archaeon]